jgi:1-acyl-sn-glycerol-3-phosphate acyltransferase
MSSSSLGRSTTGSDTTGPSTHWPILRSYSDRQPVYCAASGYPCDRENAARALHSGAVVLVFPSGDYDSYRPTFSQNVIDFNGRTGYIKTAIEAGVPIVPMVSTGGQETQLFVARGNRLAKRLGLKRIRTEILPLSFGFPFGPSVFFPPNLPLPAKIVAEVLDPIDITDRFGEEPDVDQVDGYVREVMQTALRRLARQRRFPLLG